MSEFDVASRMQRHDLHKLHGLGNDFLVWFRPDVPADASERARRWCDRHTGFGADGLVVAIDRRSGTQFVLFNADGGRAEISGNGLRCFGHAIARSRGLDQVELEVETDAGSRTVQVAGALAVEASATVDMGPVAAGPRAVDVAAVAGLDVISVATVDVGNPHIVVEVADATAHDIAAVGPAVEAHYLPTGINVHLVSVGGAGLEMNIWERGVGVTMACGSGATAAAATALRGELSAPSAESVEVAMPGGAVRVTRSGDHYLLTGPSVYLGAVLPWEA